MYFAAMPMRPLRCILSKDVASESSGNMIPENHEEENDDASRSADLVIQNSSICSTSVFFVNERSGFSEALLRGFVGMMATDFVSGTPFVYV